MDNRDMQTEDLVLQIRDWSIDRFSKLTKKKQLENAIALEEEFSEWLSADVESEDIEVLTLE